MSRDGLVGLVDIFAKNTKRWAIKRWAGLAGPAILKKYKIPVDGLAGLGWLAGWASCLKDSLCLGMSRDLSKNQ